MLASFNQIPRDIQLLVFSYLRPEELGRYSRVCKLWCSLANTESLWNALTPSIAFGKREWEKYLGDVGEEPPLPREIYKVLKSSCPFWKGMRVEETHLLTLIPKTVNGQPLTLNFLNQLMQHPKQGQPTKYACYSDEVAQKYGSTSLFKSTWVLLTKEVIPGSQAKDFGAQVQLLTEQSQKAGMAYEVPKLLEVATSVFMEYLREEKRLYSNNPWTYTRCQENVSDRPSWPTAVGGFGVDGLRLYKYSISHGVIGLGGMRKFGFVHKMDY